MSEYRRREKTNYLPWIIAGGAMLMLCIGLGLGLLIRSERAPATITVRETQSEAKESPREVARIEPEPKKKSIPDVPIKPKEVAKKEEAKKEEIKKSDLTKKNEFDLEEERLASASVRRDFALLNASDQSGVKFVAEMLANRQQWEQMTGDQIKMLRTYSVFYNKVRVREFFFWVADESGANELVKALKLKDEFEINVFKMRFAFLDSGSRQIVRQAIMEAKNKGISSLAGFEKDLIRPFKEHLRNLPD